MANEEHLAILKKGVEVWNDWKKKNPSTRTDRARVALGGADIRGVTLVGGDLSEADLEGAVLSGI